MVLTAGVSVFIVAGGIGRSSPGSGIVVGGWSKAMLSAGLGFIPSGVEGVTIGVAGAA